MEDFVAELRLELTQLKAEIQGLREAVKRTNEIVDDILTTLRGNSKNGLVTKVALTESAIKRLWWWLGGISTAILGLVLRTLWHR